ncbi:uncharacterized protein [Cherax quadricarinatus]|uniref:uncharacterized protein n=1 Tax=Cherax quadricarinatus TaxID=27406 RepID=UPI002378BE32|nr:uncharacterized protein LOC128689715 [Cherax quadricarinatus]
MIHRRLLALVSALVFMGVCASASEPGASPWQALNPALTDTNPYKETEADTTQETFEPTHLEANATSELTPEEEFLVSNIPINLPFKMEKKQLAVAMKLLKEAVKPIIKNKALHQTVAYIDSLLGAYREDLELQMYMTLLLDSFQDMFEGKEAVQFHKVLRGFFTEISDEATARTIDDMWRSTMDLVSDPFRDYFVRPVNNYLVAPISNAVSGFADRIGRWMGSRKHYVNVKYPESYSRWSEAMSTYANRLSDWTSQARQGIELAARMLEAQDQARGCAAAPCDFSAASSSEPEVYE